MPYLLRKLPNKDLYRVRNKETGRILAKATTYENAIKHIRLLYRIENKSQATP